MNTAGAWHLEHKQFTQFLAFLESQLAILRAGESPNYDLMCDVTNYLCHFGARYHHARESVAFGYILEANPEMSGTIHRLVREHADVVAKGQDVDALLARTFAGDAAGEIANALGCFVDEYRRHIDAEEQDVVPCAEANLSDEQWENVARAAPSGPDPFMRFATSRHNPTFGSEAQARYRTLCERIQMGTARPWAWPRAPRIEHAAVTHAGIQSGQAAALPRRSWLAPGTAADRRLMIRRAIELFLVCAAFLQYDFLDVELQILELPSLFQDLQR